MSRMLSVVSCALALLFLASLAFGPVEAAAPKKFMCQVTGWDGKKLKWACKADQKCCYDWVANKGACIASSAICL